MGIAGLLRKPAKQRAVALWNDQEKRIKELNEKLGEESKISYTDIVREGVDRVLKDLESTINKEG